MHIFPDLVTISENKVVLLWCRGEVLKMKLW